MSDVEAPEAHGFDAARLARIPAFLEERYLKPGKLPCALTLVGRDDAIVHLSTQGLAREGGEALRPDALFRIASMTKPITSVAFMMLVEEGKVALDTPVHHVLTEWRTLGVDVGGGRIEPSSAPMRMVDLLRHTSGLTYGLQHRTPIDAAYRTQKIGDIHSGVDLESMQAALAKLPLEFSPGAAWNYSVSTDVLGLVVQRLTGMPLEDFLRTRIFAPLGMSDTGFTVPESERDRITDAYELTPERKVAIHDNGARSRWLRKPALVSGGGGLVSTARDYHRFCRMLLRGGELDGVRLLAPKTVALMTMNHLPGGADLTQMSRSLFSEAANAGTGFGFGFAVTIDVARTMLPGSLGSYYWGGLFSTSFFIDPVERLIFIFMTQLMPSTAYPIRRELRTLVYSALTGLRA